MTSYLQSTVTMRLPCTVSKSEILAKIMNFSIPVYLTSPLMGFLFKFCNVRGAQKTITLGLPDEKKFDYIVTSTIFDTIHDRQTDGRTTCTGQRLIQRFA